MIKRINDKTSQQNLLAIWVSSHHETYEEGVTFFTPNELEMQVGYMRYNAGHEFKAHKHIKHNRVITRTCETLLICKGALRFDLYREDGDPVFSGVAVAGDILILIAGGHGFQATEDLELIECKQGSFNPKYDKCPLFAEDIKETETHNGTLSNA